MEIAALNKRVTFQKYGLSVDQYGNHTCKWQDVFTMSDRIKGITVEIGGDTTNLSKSLESVNKSIRTTQSQLRDVSTLLKLDPGNTNLLKQKQEYLNTAIGETETKLKKEKEALQATHDQIYLPLRWQL